MDQAKPAVSPQPLSPAGQQYGAIPRASINFGGNKRFGLILGGAAAVIVILIIAAALMPKGGAGTSWFSVAQEQQEVVRICGKGNTAYYQATRNFAVTCTISVSTDQLSLLNYMKQNKMSFKTKELGLKANAETDAKLKQATSSSSFDDSFRKVMVDQLNTYDQALTAQMGVTTGTNGRGLLTKAQQNAELLLKMAQDTSDKSQASGDNTAGATN
jgi:hypothetical protein